MQIFRRAFMLFLVTIGRNVLLLRRLEIEIEIQELMASSAKAMIASSAFFRNISHH